MSLNEVFNKVIFLLGAGASKGAGCLLSREMLADLKVAIDNLTASDEYVSYKKDFDEIYTFIRASLNYQATMKDPSREAAPNLNIEDFVMVLRQLMDKEFIIPYPLIGNWNGKILNWELNNGDIFEQFKRFITSKLVTEWTTFDPASATSMLAPIREVVENSETFKINLFSLNYDLIFESTLNSGTAQILDNGFSVKRVDGDALRYWSADFGGLNPTKVNLFKLHGSLDWAYENESEEISIKDNLIDGEEPLIIFGSYSKMLSFDPFLYLLSTFRNCLEEAAIFVVIGYSFHDKYINNLLIQQLSRNTSDDVPKKLIIVDPSRDGQTSAQFAEELRTIQESKSIEDVINFKQISPDRIKLVPMTASDFYKGYFSDSAGQLVAELTEAKKSDEPFTDLETFDEPFTESKPVEE